MNPRAAFTLVELAIVLVIIGLIVGGVLVGQDLIKSGQIRATISDIERYNAAATTFRGKYSGLPGDLLNTRAVQFGFNTTANDAARDGTFGKGDGNGNLQGYQDLPSGGATLGGETLLFWVDLSKAGLITFSASLDSTTATALSYSNQQLGSGIVPKSKLRDTALFSVLSFNTDLGVHESNRFVLGQFFANGVGNGVIVIENSTTGLTPIEAFGIDQKLDDGIAVTGNIYVVRDEVKLDSGPCTDVNGGYNTLNDILANTDTCALSIRASF